jgi:hypothetical protein
VDALGAKQKTLESAKGEGGSGRLLELATAERWQSTLTEMQLYFLSLDRDSDRDHEIVELLFQRGAIGLLAPAAATDLDDDVRVLREFLLIKASPKNRSPAASTALKEARRAAGERGARGIGGWLFDALEAFLGGNDPERPTETMFKRVLTNVARHHPEYDKGASPHTLAKWIAGHLGKKWIAELEKPPGLSESETVENRLWVDKAVEAVEGRLKYHLKTASK